jgi:hypothetical protein
MEERKRIRNGKEIVRGAYKGSIESGDVGSSEYLNAEEIDYEVTRYGFDSRTY